MKDPVEEAFFDFIDLCLEDHENFQNGFEDARTAFNENYEDEEPFDIAEHAFFQGYKTLEPKVSELWNALNVLANGFTEQELIDRIGQELTDKMLK